MLVKLLLSLTWKSVIVLHDHGHGIDSDTDHPLEASGISYMDYVISSATEERLLTILRDVEKMFQPDLNVLLLCDVSITVSVLRQMSGICGTRSNSSVDWCHVSRVLVVGTSDDLPVLLESNILVENVAVLESSQEKSTKSRVWTLMFQPGGRAFADVALFKGAVRNPTDVFPNVKYGYNGRQLTAVMKENHFGYGYVKLNKRRLFGFSLDVLNLLAQDMNFTIIPPREDDWGQNINGSWTGIFGTLQRREADLAPEMLTIHIDRTAVADYIMPPVAESKQVILYQKESDVDDNQMLIFLHPFQTYAFIALGVSLFSYIIALSSVRMIFSEKEFPVTSKDNNVDQNTETGNKRQNSAQEIHRIILSTSFEIVGTTLKQGSTISSSKDSERILVAAWWMFTTIISAVYCGTMMSSFAIRLEKPPFSNLAELAEREDYSVGYDVSSITGNLFENSKLSHVMVIKQRVLDSSARDLDVLSNNVTKHMQKVKGGKYAFIGGPSLIQVSYADCKLNMIDTEFRRTFESFYLPKQSPFKHDFEKSMSYLSASGILQRTYQEWFPSTEDGGCPEEEFPKAVSLVKIYSIFIAMGVGLICSAVILAGEIVWYKVKQALCRR